jgi:hypothetical protein
MNTPKMPHHKPIQTITRQTLNGVLAQTSVLSVPDFLLSVRFAQVKLILKQMFKNLKRFKELEMPTPTYQRLTQISPLET